MAGDYAGVGSGETTCFGSISELGGIQCSESGGTCSGRCDCGRGRLRHNIPAKRLFVPGRDLVSPSLEAADCDSTEEAARVVGNWRRLRVCAPECAGEVGAA